MLNAQEIQRIIQYVTARTSYARDIVSHIVQTGMNELSALASTTTHSYDRPALFEYICQWSMKQTRYPEPQVREVLECAGKWLDDMCEEMERQELPNAKQP